MFASRTVLTDKSILTMIQYTLMSKFTCVMYHYHVTGYFPKVQIFLHVESLGLHKFHQFRNSQSKYNQKIT